MPSLPRHELLKVEQLVLRETPFAVSEQALVQARNHGRGGVQSLIGPVVTQDGTESKYSSLYFGVEFWVLEAPNLSKNDSSLEQQKCDIGVKRCENLAFVEVLMLFAVVEN